MDGFSNSGNGAAIRGYIMRCLVKGYHFSGYLYYLEQCKLIEFTDKKVDALHAMQSDAVARLTAEGIRFIENGGNTEMGIDL